MLWLPALSRGDRSWRLPMACSSTATVFELLLAGPAEFCSARLAEALECDPGLALWCVCRAGSGLGAPPRTAAQLGRWLAISASESLIWSEGHPALIGADQLTGLRALARNSLETAALAFALVKARSPAEAEESYLLGLLHNCEQWLALGLAESEGCANMLPDWLRQALATLPADHPVAQAREVLADRLPMPAEIEFNRAAIGARIHTGTSNESSDGVWRLLPVLSQKLARLRRLETRFEECLETEKLAAMAEFAAGAGHEINNPVAVIAGRAQLFLRGERDPERRRELAVMNGQAMRVYEMISNMMLFARPPAPKLASCDLSTTIAKAARELGAEATARRVTLATAVFDEPLVVRADCDQLDVVLRAMIENSVEALLHGGRVEITARRKAAATGRSPAAEYAEIVVRDNGPGISAEVRRHLFDPFYSGRPAGRGLGLGLSKCWRIVNNHGGCIEVESEPGCGAVFIVRLPLAAGS